MTVRTRIRTLLLVVLAGAIAPSTSEAVNEEDLRLLRLYAEALTLAHQSYGTELDYRDLVYGSIQGSLRRLDPHTSFLPPRSYADLREQQEGTFYGVGILVSRRNGRITVISPVEGTPAHRAGLRAGDVIVAVDGESTETLTLDEAVDRIKGPKGTPVTLEVARQGLSEPLPVTIVRDEIPQTTVRYAYMLTDDVGYVRLTDFSRSTFREMQQALADLRKRGMERLLLDLRNNGGGLLDQTVLVADLFLPPEAMIVSTSGRTPDAFQELRAGDDVPEVGLPLVVLVNTGTASAAEILAGAIQDHDVGLVVGTPTWGKGLVQTVYNLSYGSGIALTTSRYHTPSGRVIQRDYSDYYDYFTGPAAALPEEPADPPSAPGETFFTELGREVYGGGGITPDVVVELPEMSESLQRLYLRNAFFDFAVRYTTDHPQPEPVWEPDVALVEELAAWAVETEIMSQDDADEALADAATVEAIRRQIHADVLNSVVGSEASHRALASGDRQIERGLELFDEAAALLDRQRRATGTELSRPVPEPPATVRREQSTDVTAALAAVEEMPPPAAAAYTFLLGKGLADEGVFGEALGTFERSLELDGADPYQHLEPVKLYGWLSRLSRDASQGERLLAEAAERVEAASQRFAGNLDVLRELAEVHLQRAERDRAALGPAREALERVLAVQHDDVEAMVALAMVYRFQGSPEEAVGVLVKAESRLPTAAVRSRLAQAMVEAGDLDGAEEVLERILEQLPSSLDHWLLLVDLASRQGEHRRAVELIRSAPAEIQSESTIQQRLERELAIIDGAGRR
jgi:carboxyl-terminal processing protease